MGSVWPPFVILDRICTSPQGPSGLQYKVQAGAYFATKLKFNERELRKLSTNTAELANDGHGENPASREAGDRAYCGRE